MTRNRASAKAAGASFERNTADYLDANIGEGDGRIDRKVKTGAKDRGDIGGVRLSPALRSGRVVVECKNVAPPKHAPTGAEIEALITASRLTGGDVWELVTAISKAYRPALAQKLSLGPWLNEAAAERGNDDAVAGVVIFKRHGVSAPGKQIVAMEVDDLVALLTGERPTEATT